jgi:hypothetical protein
LKQLTALAMKMIRLFDEGGVKMLAASNDGDRLRMSETLDRSTRIEIRPRKSAWRPEKALPFAPFRAGMALGGNGRLATGARP